MKRKGELKEIDIKSCTCYYFDDIVASGDIYSVNIQFEKKLHKNILIFDIAYKTFMGSKPLTIWFDKID